MKIRYIILLLTFISSISFSQIPQGSWQVDPDPFLESQQITFTVSDINSGNLSGVNDIYLWTWYTKFGGGSTNPDSEWNGQWDNSNEGMKMTKNLDGSYSFSFTPKDFFSDTGIETIGVLAKAKDATGDKKSQDFIFQVGLFEVNLISPSGFTSVIESGENLEVEATSSSNSNFKLKENNNLIDEVDGVTSYSYTITNITQSLSYTLLVTDIESGSEIERAFDVFIKPDVSVENIPYSEVDDGLNFINGNVIFVLNAPGKSFVNLVGSFNNWEVDDQYLMKYDDTINRFWFVLSGVDQSAYHSYQYLVDGSIYIADPYSPIILDSYNDSYVCKTSACGFSTFPSYPKNNKHAATMFKVDDGFSWEDDSFIAPNEEDLIIYELLIRDFHEDKSFESVVGKLDYLQGLGINAIELMPVNEFDGNSSWGYNPSFHMAVDKIYGSPTKFKELVNECHKRGIAVILDVVYNHATGQNPYFRLWNTENNSYVGSPTTQNPFFQESPVSESYLNYFNDMNHESDYVRDYVRRVNNFLINEYHLDGFRFDLTKGFTNQNIAENYSSERVNYLKKIADDVWDNDEDTYIIFEHFQNEEEKVFSEYGIMSWGEENYHYNEATMGYPSDFKGVSYKIRGFSKPTLIGFMESHDKERLMYKNIIYGNSSENYDVKDFNNSLGRMKAAGSLFLTVPGPKMIWQFGELGYELSINTCEDGSIDGDCKLSPKKSAFTLGMDKDKDRIKLYNTWSRILQIRKIEKIFNTNKFNTSFSSELKHMVLEDESPGDGISKVIIISNFGTESKEISGVILPDGEWFDIFRNNSKVIVSQDNRVTLYPGQFMILADKMSAIDDDDQLLLSLEKFNDGNSISIYPNPTLGNTFFNIKDRLDPPYTIHLFNSSGQLISKVVETRYKFSINFSGLARGTYNLKVHSKGNSFTKKLIKK